MTTQAQMIGGSYSDISLIILDLESEMVLISGYFFLEQFKKIKEMMVFYFVLFYDKSARSLRNSKRLPKVSSLARNKPGATKGTHKTIVVRGCIFIALIILPYILFYS